MNLLPQEEKQAVENEYCKRLMLVALIFLAGALMIWIIPVVVSYIISNYEIEDLKREMQAIGQINLSNNIATSTVIARDVKNKLDILNRPLTRSLPQNISDIFSSIIALAKINEKVRLTSLSYDQVDIKNDDVASVGHRVVLSGVANDRTSLQNFVKTLQSQSAFSSVDLPVSNLIVSKDVPFFATIMIKQ